LVIDQGLLDSGSQHLRYADTGDMAEHSRAFYIIDRRRHFGFIGDGKF